MNCANCINTRCATGQMCPGYISRPKPVPQPPFKVGIDHCYLFGQDQGLVVVAKHDNNNKRWVFYTTGQDEQLSIHDGYEPTYAFHPPEPPAPPPCRPCRVGVDHAYDNNGKDDGLVNKAWFEDGIWQFTTLPASIYGGVGKLTSSHAWTFHPPAPLAVGDWVSCGEGLGSTGNAMRVAEVAFREGRWQWKRGNTAENQSWRNCADYRRVARDA